MASAPADRLLRAGHGRHRRRQLANGYNLMQTAADGRPIDWDCGLRESTATVLSAESVQMSSFGNYEVVAVHQGRHFAGHLHTRSLAQAGPQLTALDFPRAHESSAYPAAHRVYVDAD